MDGAPTVAENSADALLDDIAATVNDALARRGLTLRDCAGAGINISLYACRVPCPRACGNHDRILQLKISELHG